MPLEGFPFSRLPAWPDAQVRVLASPALGAQFVQMLLDLPAGAGTGQGEALRQVFGFVMSGSVRVTICGETKTLGPEGFFLVPEKQEWSLTAANASQLLLLEKRYEHHGIQDGLQPEPVISHVSKVPSAAWGGTSHTQLQMLLPDTLGYDFAMNIFTFSPGYGLPIVETHVMEHGLYFLEGKGLYYLGDEWMEVEKDDFIWMAPYCPQSFYATGPTPSRYLYYKNVNREISL
jgi:(S)-ureidoglycine aminohydrolase